MRARVRAVGGGHARGEQHDLPLPEEEGPARERLQHLRHLLGPEERRALLRVDDPCHRRAL